MFRQNLWLFPMKSVLPEIWLVSNDRAINQASIRNYCKVKCFDENGSMDCQQCMNKLRYFFVTCKIERWWTTQWCSTTQSFFKTFPKTFMWKRRSSITNNNAPFEVCPLIKQVRSKCMDIERQTQQKLWSSNPTFISRPKVIG